MVWLCAFWLPAESNESRVIIIIIIIIIIKLPN
jgi:hypothetical protein